MNNHILKILFLIFFYITSHAAVPFTSNCNETVCKYTVNINDPGFYIFSQTMAADSEAGLIDTSLEVQDGQLTQANFCFGGKVTSNERTTAYISFFLTEESALDMSVNDYTNLVDEFSIKIYRQFDANDGHGIVDKSTKALRQNKTVGPGDVTEFDTLPKGHYLVTITAMNTEAEGKLGARIRGLKLATKITVGNHLSQSEESGSYNGYLARHLPKGQYTVKSSFGEIKNRFICDFGEFCQGASQPTLSVKKSNSDGGRDVITSANTLKNLNDPSLLEGFVVNQLEASDDNGVIAYSLENTLTNEIKVISYENATQSYDELFSYLPGDDEIVSITDLSVSGDGHVVAYAFYSSQRLGYDYIPDGKIYIYDRSNQSTEVIDTGVGCGSNCSESDGPIESISLDADGRNLVYVPFFDFIKVLDRFEGQSTSLEDLDFNDVSDTALSNDADFLIFSSSSSQFIGSDSGVERGVFTKDLSGNGEVKLVSILADGSAIKGNNQKPVLGSNDDYILFSSNEGPVISLYLYDANKGYAEKITHVGNNSQYSIDESGTQIVFSSLLDLGKLKLGEEFRLWSLNLDDSSLSLKAFASGDSLLQPHLSADNRSLVFCKNTLSSAGLIEQSDLYILNMQDAQKNIEIGQ